MTSKYSDIEVRESERESEREREREGERERERERENERESSSTHLERRVILPISSDPGHMSSGTSACGGVNSMSGIARHAGVAMLSHTCRPSMPHHASKSARFIIGG